MTAVWLRVRGELGRHWRSWLAIVALAGLAGGLVLAAWAGARRTDTAVARFADAYDVPDVWLDSYDLFDTGPTASWGNAATISALPEVVATSLERDAAFAARDAHNRPIFAMKMGVSLDSRDGERLDRWKLLAGRRPNDRRVEEALLDSRAASTLGVRVGDTFHARFFAAGEPADFWGDPETMHTGQLESFRVVGIRAAADPVNEPAGVVRLTPAFYDAHILDGFSYGGATLALRLKHGAADLPALRKHLRRFDPSFRVRTQHDELGKIQRSIHLQVQALWLGGAFIAFLALLFVAQQLYRTLAAGALEHPTLRALGMSRRQLVGVGVILSAAVAGAASLASVAIAAALSPLLPIGLAGELEPDPGFAFDDVALVLGGLGIFAVIVAVGAAAALLVQRPVRERAGRAGATDVLGRWGLPPTLLAGLGFVRARGNRAVALSSGVAVAGVVVATGTAVAAMTFTSSLDHLFATPRLYGQTWDYRSYYIDDVPMKASIRADRSIADASYGYDIVPIRVDGRVATVSAMKRFKGAGVDPVVVAGRAPATSSEILLSPKFMHDLGVRRDDLVDVSGQVAQKMRVVGEGVVAGGATPGFGEDAAITLAALQHIQPATTDYCCPVFEARVAPGADRESAISQLEHTNGAPMTTLPRSLADFGGAEQVPLTVMFLLGVGAVCAVVQTLVIATRRRRRELAILKTLGFDRRQVVATVFWYATTLVLLGLLVGVPAGLVAGRWGWNLFANELGVVAEPTTPVVPLVLVVPAGLLVAALVAVLPGRIAAGARPALALRAE